MPRAAATKATAIEARPRKTRLSKSAAMLQQLQPLLRGGNAGRTPDQANTTETVGLTTRSKMKSAQATSSEAGLPAG